MFGSEILEVVIGLVFVYLMFSLVCSGVKEWIHYISNIRSKSLEEAIHRMLGNGTLVEAIYSHHLVKGVSQTGILKKIISSPVDSSKDGGAEGKKPVDIRSQSFSKALVESILKAVSEKGLSQAGQDEFDKIQKSINEIDNPEVKKVLNDLLTVGETAGADFLMKVAVVRSHVEKWFDTSMDKLTVWYRAKTKQLIFVVAVIFTIVFNVDTFMITRALSQDPQWRAAALVQAEVLSTQQQTQLEKVVENANGLTTDQLTQELNALKGQLNATGLPLGWVIPSGSDKVDKGTDPRSLPHDIPGWLYKILGLLISLMAISMGAPFWFDVLRGLLNIRQKIQGKASTAPDSAGEAVGTVGA